MPATGGLPRPPERTGTLPSTTAKLPPGASRPRPKAPWATTVALAAVTALSVAVTGLAGFRTGRGEADALVLQLQTQQAKIAQLTSDLDKLRAERDRIDAELRAAKGLPAPSKPSRLGHGGF